MEKSTVSHLQKYYESTLSRNVHDQRLVLTKSVGKYLLSANPPVFSK